ncbi:helix-turn-helix transcriptional regulator [Gilvimarinus chinensis]|uniref:helix-turn-helix transcriptional regulator n=1 Tax=Gilvimarinus chinensis TaxID=396005 RepID=UPI00039C40D5|nr:helix-turn-helix transcriptional regulator [Gilvimarinus chinensis]
MPQPLVPYDVNKTSLTVTPSMTQVWDKLLAFEAANCDEALDVLLDELCGLINGTAALWVGALRVNAHDPRDPLRGWRPRISHKLDSKPCDKAFAKQIMSDIDNLDPDPLVKHHVATAGAFRAYRLSDVVTDDWYQSPFYLQKKEKSRLIDRLYVITPLNADMECYITVDRVEGQAPFNHDDCLQAAALLRGLAWFQRQVALSHGLHISTAAITPTERRVLQQLLTNQSEREIATKLGLAYTTVHSYVTTIYRKFDVNGRTGLTALWLGKGLEVC